MATSLSMGRLASRLGALLQGAPESRDETHRDIIANGDFRIDNQSRTVTVRGRELILTSEEFDLLVFLVGHPRRVVTSRTLLSTRCGAHEVRKTQFMRVLATLRQKLDVVAGREAYIRTEPWIVYRFDPGS
jgi:two-component system response regulator VicR